MPRMTVDLLCRCTGQAKRKREENGEQFLRRITHLYCQEKGIETVEGLASCRSLSVLYLYDNFISRIDGIAACTMLTHLYLQNNHISKIENLSSLHRLTKLYLSGNGITVVEGLEGLTDLTELHVANQRLPEGEKLLFEPRSLHAISTSLTVLNTSGNALDTIEDLHCLSRLTHLTACDNGLTSMKELGHVLSQWPSLTKLELSGNPLCQKYKYRDRVITVCQCLGMLDGREVRWMERQFLVNWKAMRRAKRKRHRGTRRDLGPPTNQLAVRGPLTMPALPARQPLRAEGRKRALLYGHGTQEERSIKLPEIRQLPNSAIGPMNSLSPLKRTPEWRTLAAVDEVFDPRVY